MITSKLMVCCQGAVRDVESNNISVFNIYEEIGGIGFPLFLQMFYVVAYLQRDANDDPNPVATLDIEIAGQSLHSQPIDFAFGEKLRTRLMAQIQGLAIPQPGDLNFVIKINGAVLNSWQVKIISREKPQLELKAV